MVFEPAAGLLGARAARHAGFSRRLAHVPYWFVDKTPVAVSAGQRARALLQSLSGGSSLSRSDIEQSSLQLAADLFQLAESLVDTEERSRRQRLSRLLMDPKGQLLSVFLTDRVARDKTFDHAAGQLSYLVQELGMPEFMTLGERLQLGLGTSVAGFAPRAVGKLMARQIRREVEGLVFPIETGALSSLLARRSGEGVRVNVNQLGEEVLGEARAEQRLRMYIELLSRPDVETISVKLSSIFSQVDLFAWDASLLLLAERLRPILRAAASFAPPKLVYLDMEAYRDLRLTVDLVRRVLDEPEFVGLTAGMVLQAYIPDSAALQRELIEWALARRRRGGAPLRLRIVKGANLAAERVQSARMGLPVPIYPTKHEVDANYKRMLYVGTEPAHAEAVHLGIASHNIFDLALGLVLRSSRGVGAQVGFEVLEGMANSVQRALTSLGAPVLTYAPAVHLAEMDTAVAYLIRRLDENTSPENYLRHAFSMRQGGAEYEAQAQRFREAHRHSERVSDEPRRPQDRFAQIQDLSHDAAFENEPDTDFAVAAHRDAVAHALVELIRRPCFELAPVIGGVRRETRDVASGFDPSRPRIVPYRYRLAGESELRAAVGVAVSAARAWAALPGSERCEHVRRVAQVLRRRRAELIAAMVMDAGKRVTEADAEVSEAIDFAEYYLRIAETEAADPGLLLRPKGVVLVTSPWNFPLAIPLSGVLAGLLGGNAVIFKPAVETAFVGERLAELVWEAGVPRDALQLILCRDEEGTLLLRDPRIDAVVLTGATSTAQFFLTQRARLDLHAETGGKNALIVSALADRELAIRDLVASAFGYAGQKCSAASVAILPPEVHDDLGFMRQLGDAAASLVVGSAWDASSVVTPLIRPPNPALLRGLTELEPNETWLVEPRCHPENPRLWSPGIKLGVKVGSFSHQTELFGPVLSVIRASDFEHALAIANATPYGLTAGLHSLDEREQARFIERVACGNLYVNRTITGAIVGRQPFGGHKQSSVGPGAKAGGPNYVSQLQQWADAEAAPSRGQGPQDRRLRSVARLLDWAKAELEPSEHERLVARSESYARWLEQCFSRKHPSPAVLGQDNWLAYVKCGPLLAVAGDGHRLLDVLSVAAAARLVGNELHLSLIEGARGGLTPAGLDVLGRAGAFTARVERVEAIEERLSGAAIGAQAPAQSARRGLAGEGHHAPVYERIRWVAAPRVEPAESLLRACAAAGSHLSTRPVLGHGRYELLFYHREQTVSVDYHRYGHLGWRSLDASVHPASAAEQADAQSTARKMNSSATFSPSGPAARGP